MCSASLGLISQSCLWGFQIFADWEEATFLLPSAGPGGNHPPFLVPMKQKVLMQVSEFLSGEFLGCLLIFPSFCTLFKYELL